MPTVSVPNRILVVDDEPAVREAVEAHLRHRGYEVLTAVSGEEALGILARQKISCMVADARLFGTVGETAAALACSSSLRRKIVAPPYRQCHSATGPRRARGRFSTEKPAEPGAGACPEKTGPGAPFDSGGTEC